MDEFGFPMLLMSNASKRLFPNNHASRFTVQLPCRKQFDEKWVVGVTDFYFPLGFELDDVKKTPSSEPTVKQANKRKPCDALESVTPEKKVALSYPDDQTVTSLLNDQTVTSLLNNVETTQSSEQ